MAEITLEQVEKLRAVATVSYEEAKAALEETDGDLLSAVINLERAGKAKEVHGGFYSTRTGESGKKKTAACGKKPTLKLNYTTKDGKTVSDLFKEIFDAAWNLLRHCTINQLEVWRHGELMVSVPILAVLVLIFFFFFTLPVAIVGLFFGFRYHFSGPDLGGDTVNKFMDNLSEKADELKNYVTGPSDKSDQ